MFLQLVRDWEIRHLPRPLRKAYFRLADRPIVDRPLFQHVNAFREELGAAPVRRVFDGWIHSPQLVIGLFPDWYAQPQPDWPPHVSLTGFPLWDESEVRSPSEELERFLADGEPPLVFTAGSAMLQATRFFEVSVDMCKAAGCRGLLLTQFPEQLPARLPPGVRHFDYIPFSAVLPRSAALIHHGGIGTTAQAISAGIPQLIVPNTHDQPDNAVRGQAPRCWRLPLAKSQYSWPTHAKVARPGEPWGNSNCKRAAQKITRDSLLTACRLIEQLATSPSVNANICA